MNKAVFPVLFALLLCSTPHAQAVEQVLPEQLQQIESLQRRADKLAFGVPGANNYHLAKARAWLDMAQSEYHEKDSSGIISAAIGQAESLLDALEKIQTGITMDTPLEIPGSEALRPDLLNKIGTLKNHTQFSCGQLPLAKAEVYLVWAGHEFHESGQSHAASYIRNVENLIYDAQVAINACMETKQAIPPVMEKITLSSDALFAFGQATLNPSALSRLDELAESIKKMANEVEQVILVGHTDRLRSDGHPERNQILSEQRAESIKQYLIGKGIAADRILASGAGSTQPLVQCPANLSKAKQIACLQPNRRVEIVLRGNKVAGDNEAGGKKESVK